MEENIPRRRRRRRCRPPPPPPPPLFSIPPPDRDKPPIPYTQGQTLTISRHVPPPPLGRPHPNIRPLVPREILQRMTQFEYCLSADPLQGSTISQETFSFTITKQLAVRDGRGAQVVIVNDDLAAKIYDPLYYPAYFWDTSIREDVVKMAERHYSREAAAYEGLNALFGGTVIPKYYGSWTCEVPTNTASGVRMRPVRLILMEFIKGTTLLELDPHALSEEQRSNVMVKAIDANLAIFHHGVGQEDFSPRNIMCCSSSALESPALRVVIIDFNHATILRLAWFFTQKTSDLPISPIICHWGGLEEFTRAGWVPSPPGEWLWKHWGGSKMYQPITETGEWGVPPVLPPEA